MILVNHHARRIVLRCLLAATSSLAALNFPAISHADALHTPTTQPVHRTLFAAMFENQTGDPQYDAAASGMGDLIAAMFGPQKDITIVERQKLFAISREQALTLRGLVGPAYALQAGKMLDADTVLTGHLYLADGKLMIGVKVIEIATERVAASDAFECSPDDLPEAALRAARQLSPQLSLPLPVADLSQLDASPNASLHFVKALADYYAGDMDAAIMQFMRTTDLDPDFNDAHYFCGICYAKLGEQADAAIEWREYLQRDRESARAQVVTKLLADADNAAADDRSPRLGPDTSQPVQQAAHEGK